MRESIRLWRTATVKTNKTRLDQLFPTSFRVLFAYTLVKAAYGGFRYGHAEQSLESSSAYSIIQASKSDSAACIRSLQGLSLHPTHISGLAIDNPCEGVENFTLLSTFQFVYWSHPTDLTFTIKVTNAII